MRRNAIEQFRRALLVVLATCAVSVPAQQTGATVPVTSTSSQTSAVAELDVVVEPAPLPVYYNKNSDSLRLVLTNNAASTRQFNVLLGSLKLKTGEVIASAVFEDTGKAEANNVSLVGKEKKSLTVRVAGLSNLGAYEGSVRVRSADAAGTETVRSVQVVRQVRALDLAFTGKDMANGVLVLKPGSESDSRFSVLVQNPAAGYDATVKVGVSEPFRQSGSSMDIKLETKELQLLPGASQPVKFELVNISPSGERSAQLSFTDTETGASKYLDVRVQGAFVPGRHWAVIIGLVVIGAILSAVVGAAIPNLVARNRIWTRIGDLRQKLSALPAAEMWSKSGLARDIQHIDQLVNEADWFTPSAGDRLAEQELRSLEMEKRVALLADLSELRTTASSNEGVPTSARTGLIEEIDAAAVAVVRSAVDVAKLAVEQVRTKVTDARTISDVRTALDAAIARLPTVDAAQQAGADPTMIKRLGLVMVAHKKLGQATTRPELVALDFEAQCALLYFVEFGEKTVQISPALAQEGEARLLEQLTWGKADFLSATALVQSMDMGISLNKFDNAINDISAAGGLAEVVVTPPDPIPGKLVTFRLAFNDAVLNRSPMLRSVPIHWSFSTDAAEGFGIKVEQYFRGKPHAQTIKYTVKVGPRASQQRSGTVVIPASRWLGDFATQAQAVSFLVTLGGAILLAILSRSADARALETVQDYINPFLWGFGLDRMKALVAGK